MRMTFTFNTTHGFGSGMHETISRYTYDFYSKYKQPPKVVKLSFLGMENFLKSSIGGHNMVQILEKGKDHAYYVSAPTGMVRVELADLTGETIMDGLDVHTIIMENNEVDEQFEKVVLNP